MIDVYHNSSEELYQTDVPDMFDVLSDTLLSTLVKSHGSDPGLSACDTVVGKVTDDLSRQLSDSVKGHEQSYSCLSDSGCMIPIIKQSILQTGSKSSVSAFDNLGPVKLRSAFRQLIPADLVRLDDPLLGRFFSVGEKKIIFIIFDNL